MKITTRLAVLSLLAAATLMSAGCASTGTQSSLGTTLSAIGGFTITQGQLDAAQNSYDAAVLAPMASYASLPRCKTGQTITVSNPCHDRTLLKKIRNADKTAQEAFANTQAQINAGDNTGISAAWGVLQNAISTATNLIAISGAS